MPVYRGPLSAVSAACLACAAFPFGAFGRRTAAALFFLLVSLTAWLALRPVQALASEHSVGQVTFLVGKAQQAKAGVAKPIRRGDAIEAGATVETSNNGHVHIRFVDGALVSIRPASSLRITEYVFNKANPAGSKIKFELVEGAARAVTGAAGKAAKDNFRLNTPVAALGVRGTDFSVFSSMSESLVNVNSGAVVISQFGDGCSRTGSGPCAGPSALEVRAGGARAGASALVSVASERPVALPEGTVRMSSVAVAALGAASSSGSNATAGASGAQGSSASVAAVSGEDVAVVADKAAVDGVSKALVGGGDVSLPTAGSQASKLAWGRWYGAAWPSDQTLSYLQARDGRRVTVGNSYVSLYRAMESPFVIPDKGSARLALQSGQVHWIGALDIREPGTVDSGSLTVNFGDKRFTTELVGTHPRVGGFSLQASGVLSTSSLAPGIFVSDQSASGARVAGAISSNATEAGYFFEQPAARSILMGTTNWRR